MHHLLRPPRAAGRHTEVPEPHKVRQQLRTERESGSASAQPRDPGAWWPLILCCGMADRIPASTHKILVAPAPCFHNPKCLQILSRVLWDGGGPGEGAGKSLPDNWGFLVAKATFSTIGGGSSQPLPLWLPVHMALRRRHICPGAPGLRLLSLLLAQPPPPSAHQAASFPTPLRLAPRLPVSCSLSSWPR